MLGWSVSLLDVESQHGAPSLHRHQRGVWHYVCCQRGVRNIVCWLTRLEEHLMLKC